MIYSAIFLVHNIVAILYHPFSIFILFPFAMLNAHGVSLPPLCQWYLTNTTLCMRFGCVANIFCLRLWIEMRASLNHWSKFGAKTSQTCNRWERAWLAFNFRFRFLEYRSATKLRYVVLNLFSQISYWCTFACFFHITKCLAIVFFERMEKKVRTKECKLGKSL